ncbi:hypothetical protein BDW74DRAFT_189735 [Aspergillus multicolor]|uniref:uncharacterized protein n=1 Tax=Aspergillus multicolor TaxID=41759 RepID=UPI003CCD6DC0
MGSIETKRSVVVDDQITTSSQASSQQLSESVLQSARKAPKSVAWCFAFASGIILYGYDLVIVGNAPSMPVFQRQTDHPGPLLSLWNVANPIGGILGSLAGGYIQDRAGRRRSLTIASIVSAIGVAVACVSNLPSDINARRSVFLLAIIVQGFAVNQAICTVQTYNSEVLVPVLRGPALGLFPSFMLLGQLIGSIIVYFMSRRLGPNGYKLCFVSQWPFSALPLVVSFFMPESPTYLIRKNRLDDARKHQGLLSSSVEDANTVLEQARLSIELEDKTNNGSAPTYLDCSKAPHRRRTMIVLFGGLVSILFGLSLLSKGSYFMQVVGMNAHTSLILLQVNVGLGLLANIGSMITVAKFGRRTLTISGLIICIMLWTGMGIAGCFEGTGTIWYTQMTILLIISLTGLTVWPASYAFGAEASSLQLRAKSQGLSWVVHCLSNGVFGIVLPYIFIDDEGALGAKTGFVYTGFCVLALGIAWRIVPEMKNLSAMEIDCLFEGSFEGGGAWWW